MLSSPTLGGLANLFTHARRRPLPSSGYPGSSCFHQLSLFVKSTNTCVFVANTTIMADLQTRQRKGDPKRILPRIDMTPMVDLGFLLIAFFMFTTTLAQPKVMEVNMPYTEAPPEGGTSYPEESTVTLLLSSQHKVAYYYGNFESGEAFAAAGFEGNNPLRSVLLNKQQEAAKLPTTYSRQAHFLHVLIKPTDDCTYEDLVKALDEMSILDIRYYALADVSDAEKEWLQQNLR